MPDPESPVLSYEPPPELPAIRSRPKWVFAVVGIYLLILLGLLLAPMLFSQLVIDDPNDRPQALLWTGGGVALLIMAGLSLILVPVRVLRKRPVRRGHIIWPILGSGLLFAILLLGGGLAAMEWGRRNEDVSLPWILAGAGGVWALWSIIFGMICWSRESGSIAARLHRILIGGSVLELLVAVPAHVVVRQRSECCAGIWTGTGICAGVVVAFLAFGPSILLLYWRRWDAIRN